MRQLKRWAAEDGTTAVEYAVLASAIAAIIVTVVYAIGVKNYLYFLGFWEQFRLH